MWLGFSAAFIGIVYAFLKFLTVLHLRRLREELIVAHHDLQKTRQRIDLHKEKLEIQQSKKRTLKRETDHLRTSLQKLNGRLSAILPPSLYPQLERCRNLEVETEHVELKLLQELDLLEGIAHALEPISLLLIRLPEQTDTDLTLAISHLSHRLAETQGHFHGPRDGLIFCFLPQPDLALQLLEEFLAELSSEGTTELRAGLQAGLDMSDQSGELKRLLARSLQQARKLADGAPAGSLLLNGEAYDALSNRDAIRPFTPEEQIYIYTWKPGEGGTQT